MNISDAWVKMAGFITAYQTLTVGILGFLGVMATLVVNAWLARKAEDRKIAHETKVLRTALIAEMNAQREALIHSSDSAKRVGEPTDNEHDALVPLRRWTDIFDKSIDKLGLLTSDEVAAVLSAYLPLKELTPKIRLLERRGEAASPDYALVQHNHVQYLEELHAIYVPAFDRAIKMLTASLERERMRRGR